MSTPPATPPNPSTAAFDVVAHYHKLLTTDKTLTPPIAAIESLISLLSSSPITTVSETLSLISHASTTLLASQRNPIPVSAGTDLFQRYLITSFQNTPIPSQSGSDFTHLRNQLISNSKIFVARAKSASSKIATHALPLIRDESVIITYGSSRIVGNLLAHAADAGRWFRVLQVLPSGSGSAATTDRITTQISSLRKAGIEVATVPLAALSHALNSLPTSAGGSALVLLGTSAVLENGATVSEMGCYLVSQVARAHSIPLYVATESYKFARQFPIGYGARDLEKMGTKQEVLRFTSAAGGGGGGGGDGQQKSISDAEQQQQQLVDVTPPGLISGLITENGVMTPNAVAEELIKLWF